MNEFNDFYIKRRFSYLPSPYPNTNIEYFKDYYSANKIEVEIGENEMLFIPAGWFHFVISDKVDKDERLNVAISFFTEFDKCADCDLIEGKKIFFNNINLLKEENLNYQRLKDDKLPIKIISNKRRNKHVNISNIKKMFEDKNIIVNKSKNQLFVSNFIKDIYPDNCIEIEKKIDEIIYNGKKENYYLMQTENDFSIIGIQPPDFLNNEKKKNYSFWMNFGNVYSGLHYDIHNNILLQLKGSKKILLFPPYEREKLHLVNKLNPKLLCFFKKNLRH